MHVDMWHVTRSILCENLHGKCRSPSANQRQVFCASLPSRHAHGWHKRGILRGNLRTFRYHLDWTPALNCYRKNPSVWPPCLGKKYDDSWVGWKMKGGWQMASFNLSLGPTRKCTNPVPSCRRDMWILFLNHVGKSYPSVRGQLENAPTQNPHVRTCGFYFNEGRFCFSYSQVLVGIA